MMNKKILHKEELLFLLQAFNVYLRVCVSKVWPVLYTLMTQSRVSKT